ncbi:hypothetical protein NPIL_72981, partial [Nephila pilipes]
MNLEITILNHRLQHNLS